MAATSPHVVHTSLPAIGYSMQSQAAHSHARRAGQASSTVTAATDRGRPTHLRPAPSLPPLRLPPVKSPACCRASRWITILAAQCVPSAAIPLVRLYDDSPLHVYRVDGPTVLITRTFRWKGCNWSSSCPNIISHASLECNYDLSLCSCIHKVTLPSRKCERSLRDIQALYQSFSVSYRCVTHLCTL